MSKGQIARMKYEMSEFSDSLLKDIFIEVSYPTVNTVNVVCADGTQWTICRGYDFMKPPVVFRNMELIDNCYSESYSPALTSAKWIIMLHFQGHF